MKVKIAILLSVAAVIIVAGFVFWSPDGQKKIDNSAELQVQASESEGVIFKAFPLDFNIANPVKFEIIIDTHSGSLDFDLLKTSVLEDDKGTKYSPLEWQGAGPGGHHISGVLIFPKINNKANKIRLIINADTQRTFEWNL